jgi:hypothetical protein
MKAKIISFLFLLSAQLSFAQQIDLCDYFSIQIIKREKEGKSYFGKNFYVNKDSKDAFGKLLKKHSLRYDYLLFKCFSHDTSYSKLYPQTDSINALFCSTVKQDVRFNNYFNYLYPAKYATQQLSPLTFTKSEMMLVASRFFYCDEVDKSDTGIGYHVCIGINGIKELKTKRDLSVLEAFCIEGIFDAMNHKKEAKFVLDFSEYIKKSREKRITNFPGIDDFLILVRNDCFNDMEKNEALKKSLLAYYKKNKNNINFTIQ